MKWYYYLHTNGDLIAKNPSSHNQADFNESTFVKRWWLIETEFRLDAWTLVIEALALGARIDRIKDLAQKWNLTKEDLKEYITRNITPTEIQKTGMNKFIKEILALEPNTFWNDLIK